MAAIPQAIGSKLTASEAVAKTFDEAFDFYIKASQRRTAGPLNKTAERPVSTCCCPDACCDPSAAVDT